MRKRLTIRFLISNLIIISLLYFIFIFFNVFVMKTGFSFTDNFYNLDFNPKAIAETYKKDLSQNEEKFQLSEENIKILIDNDIWVQVLNENGEEIFSENKKDTIPMKYSLGELVGYLMNGWDLNPQSSIIVEGLNKGDRNYTFIIGYPYSEVIFFAFGFTNEYIIYFMVILAIGILLTIIFGFLYSRRLASPISDIIEDINILANGKYVSLNRKRKKSIYKKVNENIVKLSNVLKENKEEKDSIDKMKEEWIANIAHDLKTPLASINGYSQILKGEYENSKEEVEKYAAIITDKANYIEDLINDLSLVYKFKNKVVPMDIKDENIVDIIRETIINILNSPIYEEKEIEIDADEDVIKILCNKNYIIRALNNLIYNAIVHNPKETKIYINIGREKEKVFLTIADNGNGIPEDELKVLFDRYYRASNTGEAHKGTGLGMAIAKEIIEAHNGSINVESKIGEGTKTTILFLV